MINELIYYKSPLYIANKEDLQTHIARGCHNSLIARHLEQEKTIEIVC